MSTTTVHDDAGMMQRFHQFEQYVVIGRIVADMRYGFDAEDIGYAALASPAQVLFYPSMMQSFESLGVTAKRPLEYVTYIVAADSYTAEHGAKAPSWYNHMIQLLINHYREEYELEDSVDSAAYSRMSVQIVLRAAVAWCTHHRILHHVLNGLYALHQRLYPGQSVSAAQGYRVIFRAMVLACMDNAVQSVVDADIPLAWQEPLVAARMVELVTDADMLDHMEHTVRDYFDVVSGL